MSKDAIATQQKPATISLPDGKVASKDSLRKGLIKTVADAFREARHDSYSSSDWITAAAEKVVDTLFEVDEYFENVLKLQKQILQIEQDKQKKEGKKK